MYSFHSWKCSAASDCTKPWAICSDLRADPALRKKLDWRPPKVPSSLSYPVVLWTCPSHISPWCWMNYRATQISPAASPADPLRSQRNIQGPWYWHLLPRFSSGLWGVLAVAGTVTLLEARLKVQVLNISVLFRGTVHFRLLITRWICVAHQSMGVYVSPRHRSEHGAAHQALSQGMFLQSGCLLLACLGLQSKSCWPASTHKGHPVIIFCLGK